MVWLQILISLLFLVAGTLIFSIVLPDLANSYGKSQKKKVTIASRLLEDMFVWIARRKLILIFGLSPVILGVIFFILFGKYFLIIGGVIVGSFLPLIVIKQMHKRRKEQFSLQIPDAIVSLTQSLKAGLTFIQAIEVLTEELLPPISQEFAMVLKENKMGITMEESFERMNKKMDSADLNFMSTAILVAHETGGDLPKILTNLADTIRERRIVLDEVKTLTTQARWQGVIMSILPIVFTIFVYNMNPHHFDIMLNNNLGRIALALCVVLEIVGAVALNRLSRIDV